MKTITTICLLLVLFVVGFALGNLDKTEPREHARYSSGADDTFAANNPDIREIQSEWREMQAANAELSKQYQELKEQLAVASNLLADQNGHQHSTSQVQDVYQNIEITDGQHQETQTSYVEAKEQAFYSKPMDASRTSSAYEGLKLNLLNSQVLQRASLQSMECRGDLCLIEIHEPLEHITDEEEFTRQFELSVLLSESGFKSSMTVKNTDDTMTLISTFN